MPMTKARKEIVENIKTGKNNEDSDNKKNGKKDEYLKTNLT